MNDKTETETPAERAAREKAERLAEALRANLKRRKSQARRRASEGPQTDKGQTNG